MCVCFVYNKLFHVERDSTIDAKAGRVACDPGDSGKANGFFNCSRTAFFVGSGGCTHLSARWSENDRHDVLTGLVLSRNQRKCYILFREDPPSIEISSLFFFVPSTF